MATVGTEQQRCVDRLFVLLYTKEHYCIDSGSSSPYVLTSFSCTILKIVSLVLPPTHQTPEVRELSALQLSGMSARERNRAKRKARQMARRGSNDADVAERR